MTALVITLIVAFSAVVFYVCTKLIVKSFDNGSEDDEAKDHQRILQHYDQDDRHHFI